MSAKATKGITATDNTEYSCIAKYMVVHFRIIAILYKQHIKITCKLAIPTAAISPNITRYMPPTIGSGREAKKTPNLPMTPIAIIRIPEQKITRLLPTLRET